MTDEQKRRWIERIREWVKEYQTQEDKDAGEVFIDDSAVWGSGSKP